MYKRLFLILCVSALTTAITLAKSNDIVGTVWKVDSNMIEVRADSGKMVISVQVNADTAYRKWIMAKPLQQDPVAHLSDVKVGSRVHVDFGKSKSKTAETVWIVTR